MHSSNAPLISFKFSPQRATIWRNTRRALLLACAGIAGFAGHAQAATDTWANAAGGDWNTAANWTGVVPVPADTALFNSVLTGNVTLSAPATFTNLNFDTVANNSSTQNLTIGALGGSGITVSTGGAIQVLSTLTGTGKTFTVNAPLTLGGGTSAVAVSLTNNNVTAGSSINTLNIGGPISGGTTGAATLTLTGTNTTSNTISGDITNGAGTVGVSKTAAGTWVLTGNNTYSGNTGISGGTLEFTLPTSMSASSAVSVNNGGTLAVAAGGAGQFTNATSGNGTIGGLFSGLGGQAGSTVTLNTGSAVGIDTTGGSLTYAGNITNAGVGLTKLGSNALTLTGVNTYTGNTTVGGGAASVLILGNAANGGIGSAGSLIFNSSGVTLQALQTTTVSNNITMGANFGISGANSITFTGNFTEAGSLALTNTITGGGTLTFAGSTFTISNANQLTITSTANTSISNLIQDNATPGGRLAKGGGGTLFLTNNASTYSGATTLQSGILSVTSLANVGSPSALGAPSSVAAGTIAIGNVSTAATLSYAGTGSTTDRVINLAGTTGGAVIDQSGTGLLKFTSALTATGAGAKTLTLQGSTAGIGELDGAIVNGATSTVTSLTKAGTGSWILAGPSTYSGVTNITGGKLLVNNTTGSGTGTGAVSVKTTATLGGAGTISGITTQDSGSFLAPGSTLGSIGTLAFSSNLTLNNSGPNSLLFDLGLANTSDLVTVGGSLTFNAQSFSSFAFDTTAIGANDPSGVYTLFTSPNNILGGGTLGALSSTTLFSGYNSILSIDGTGKDFILTVAAVPEPSTWAMMVGGMTLLISLQQRRKRLG